MQRQELPDMAKGGEGREREMICTHCGDEMSISRAKDCNGDLLNQVWFCGCGAVRQWGNVISGQEFMEWRKNESRKPQFWISEPYRGVYQASEDEVVRAAGMNKA